MASWSSPESTSTRATASVTVPKPVPSASAVAVALAAAQLFVYDGSCRWRSWLAATTATHAAAVAATAVLALPKSLPLAAPFVFGRLTVPPPLSLGQHYSWRPTQLQLERRHGIVLEAAGRAWYGHGPAGSFFASGIILFKSLFYPSSRKGATESDRTSAAPALLLLLVHAR